MQIFLWKRILVPDISSCFRMTSRSLRPGLAGFDSCFRHCLLRSWCAVWARHRPLLVTTSSRCSSVNSSLHKGIGNRVDEGTAWFKSITFNLLYLASSSENIGRADVGSTAIVCTSESTGRTVAEHADTLSKRNLVIVCVNQWRS